MEPIQHEPTRKPLNRRGFLYLLAGLSATGAGIGLGWPSISRWLNQLSDATPTPASSPTSTDLTATKPAVETPTPKTSEIKPTNTPPAPLPTKTEVAPSPTPTPTLEELLRHGNIDFGQEMPMEITFNLNWSVNPFRALKAEAPINGTPIIYQDDFSSDERDWFEHVQFAPSTKTLALETDKYQNTIVYAHTGNWRGKPLEFERIREFLEGTEIPEPSALEYGVFENDRKSHMQEMKGSAVTLKQSGRKEKYVVAAVGYIPHESMANYEHDSKTGLDVVIAQNGGDKSDFKRFQNPATRGIIFTFCGWGPPSAPDKERYAWTRYFIALEPISSPVTQQKSQ